MTLIVSNLKKKYKPSRTIFSNENLIDNSFEIGPINFEIDIGDRVALIGSNGSGKTTLLRLITGTIKQDEGLIFNPYKTLSLIYIGRYFNQELTIIQNLKLISLIFSKEFINNNKIDEILNFSDLTNYKNYQIKRLSKGMRSRLAVSLSLFLDFKILIIDENLDAGDISFSNKLTDKLGNNNNDKSILVSSHNLKRLKEMCKKGLYIDKGKQIFFGNIDEAINLYEESIKSSQNSLFFLDEDLLDLQKKSLENGFFKNEDFKWSEFKNTGYLLVNNKTFFYSNTCEEFEHLNSKLIGYFQYTDVIELEINLNFEAFNSNNYYVHLNLHYFDRNEKWVDCILTHTLDHKFNQSGNFILEFTIPANILSGQYYAVEFCLYSHIPLHKYIRTGLIYYFAVNNLIDTNNEVTIYRSKQNGFKPRILETLKRC
jgi:ABC-type polysaccharide/polyol phosphate transport system ATPase subunit